MGRFPLPLDLVLFIRDTARKARKSSGRCLLLRRRRPGYLLAWSQALAGNDFVINKLFTTPFFGRIACIVPVEFSQGGR